MKWGSNVDVCSSIIEAPRDVLATVVILPLLIRIVQPVIHCDYIYLDTDLPPRFAQVSHAHSIEQVQSQSTNNTTSQMLKFNHPVKELIWT